MSVTATHSDGAALEIAAGADGAVTLPDGFSYARADFIESGSDLVLADADGSRLLIQGYFDAARPPDLINADGGQIAGQMVARLARPEAGGDIAQTVSDTADAAGHVAKMAGTVVAIHGDGSRTELAAGDAVQPGDVLEVGDPGHASVVLADGSVIAMSAGARTVLDAVIYDAADGNGSIALTVTAGSVVVVCGEVAHGDPDAVTIRTPMAEIAVRDAQVGLYVHPGEAERIVLMEMADGYVGEIAVRTPGGTEILNYPNQGVWVVDDTAPPTHPEVFVLDDVIATYQSALSAMPAGDGAGNDFGVGGERNGALDLGEEPAVEDSAIDGEAGDGFADVGGPGAPGEFETAAGGGTQGGTPDFIQVAGDGSSLSGIEPVGTEPGAFSVSPATTPVASHDNEEQTPGPAGPSVIRGGAGPDTLTGTPGNDTIFGGGGDDVIYGGSGDDVLRGGLGDDRIFGGGGDDAIVFAPGDGNDTVFDFGLGDRLNFEGVDVDDVDVEISGDDLIVTVKDGGGAETNRVTVKDGASYSVTETQTDDGVVIAVDDSGP